MCLTLKKTKKKKKKSLNWSPKGHFGNLRVRTEKGCHGFSTAVKPCGSVNIKT
jgi:hypothetical protein